MKATNPLEFAELINVFSEGLNMGLFTKERITQWADHFVLQDEEPDIFFIELALSNDKSTALSILSEAARNMQAETSPRPLFGALYGQVFTNIKSIDEAAACLLNLQSAELLSQQEKGFIYALDYSQSFLDVYTKSGITAQDVEKGVLAFLLIYKDYIAEQFYRWDEIDSQINHSLSQAYDKQFDSPITKVLRNYMQL